MRACENSRTRAKPAVNPPEIKSILFITRWNEPSNARDKIAWAREASVREMRSSYIFVSSRLSRDLPRRRLLSLLGGGQNLAQRLVRDRNRQSTLRRGGNPVCCRCRVPDFCLRARSHV